MAKSKKKLTKESTNTVVNVTTGEIIESTDRKEWLLEREEPDYIKLYFNAVLEFNKVSSVVTPLVTELLKYMTYADDKDGGQMIYLNATLKRKICKNLEIAEITYRTNMKKLCQGKIIRKVERDTYQFNPYIFGKGDWTNIKDLRASFDWKNGFIVLETVHQERESEDKDEETARETDTTS